MKPTWEWLLTVMDATEAQLRFGASLTQNADPAHPGHPLHSAAGLGLSSGGLTAFNTQSINLFGG